MSFKYCVLSMLLAQLLLISTTEAADAKAIIMCEQLSSTTNVLNTNAVKTAKAINKCQTVTLAADVHSRLEVLKNKLPTSIRNAVFLPDVCIKNKHFSEYLYVPESGFKYDADTRRLFTWIGSDWAHSKGDFRLVPTDGDYFYIISTNNHEYLFAAGNNYATNNRRRVFTWEPDWDDDKQAFNDRQAQWQLEPVDNTGQVYIKNRQYGEYIYAAEHDFVYDRERRTLFTWNSNDNGCYRQNQCIWEIGTC